MVELTVQYNPAAREWIIFELQGTIGTHGNIPLKDVAFGDLHFNTQGEPMLVLGHHLLKGRVVNLSNPIAVFEKQTKAHNSTLSESDMCEKTFDFEVIALVKKKIVFASRPKPILVKYETTSN